MRDPYRIDAFCKRLAECWKKEPDWRFGQLMVNVLGACPMDPFFPEDDWMLGFIEGFFKPKEDLRESRTPEMADQ